MRAERGSETLSTAAAEATPESAPEPATFLVAAALVTSGLAGLSLSRGRGRRLLERADTPVVPPWSASDVATVILIHLASQVIAASLLLPQPTPNEQWSNTANDIVATTAGMPSDTVVWQQLAAGVLASALTLAGAVPFLVSRSGSWGPLLLASRAPRGDVAAGLLMLLAITPPLLILAGLLNQIVPYHHPILDFLAAEQGPAAMLLTVASAVVAAPIVEEFFFRGVLQGWLERVAPAAAVPVSAFAFGLAHIDHGLGWIPLVGFGIATGLLTRHTGSLLASIVLHAGFNAIGVAAAMLQVHSAAG